MKIEKVHLVQYRAAVDLTLQFDNRMNIFFGTNGAGKTTLLEAVSTALSWYSSRMFSSSGKGGSVSIKDITNGTTFSRISVTVSHEGAQYDWSIAKSKNPADKERSELKGVDALVEYLLSSKPSAKYPLTLFYPVSRSVIDIPLRIKNRHTFVQKLAFDRAASNSADFRTFFEWFREQEDIENEYITDAVSSGKSKDEIQRNKQLDAVRSALRVFMPDFEGWRIKRSPLRMVVRKQGKELVVNQLSDGEKCLLALVGDIARRLAMANEDFEGVDPLRGEGIIMIDEIDLHLHPAWQRNIVSRLMDTFPNCQFFLSSHSPIVLNQVFPENIILLRNENGYIATQRPAASYGRTCDLLLEDTMDGVKARPDDIVNRIEGIHALLKEKKTSEAREALYALRKVLINDPETIRLTYLIDAQEKWGI